MKAIRFHEVGEPGVMRWEEVSIAAPAKGQLQIRTRAVAVNFRDIYLRRGQNPPASFPSGIGIDSVGVIEAIGPDVAGFAVGDRIACVAGPDNAYAEARLVPAARAIKLPDGISDEIAAAIMVRGMTARYLVRETYPVKEGDTILVHAAAGGVGLILCQWAKQIGAIVIGTVGSRDKAEIALGHGCDHAIVSSEENFAERVRALTGGAGVAAVYDSIGQATFEGSLACLKPRGVLASFGEASGDPEPIAPRRLGALGSIFLTHPSLGNYTATRPELLANAEDLFGMLLQAKIRAPLIARYKLSEAAEAHRALESRRTAGALVLVA